MVDAIAALPERQRRILLMSRLEKQSHSAIASHFDVSTRTVELELKRALTACHALRRK
jgi:RNA polymerase sigma factor (sigma-70 family)